MSDDKVIETVKVKYSEHWASKKTASELLDYLQFYSAELVKVAGVLRDIQSGKFAQAEGESPESEKLRAAYYIYEVGDALMGIGIGLSLKGVGPCRTGQLHAVASTKTP